MAADATAGRDMPLKRIPQIFTVATAPPAASYPYCLIQISNGNAGANTLAFSDGTDWKVIALGATAAAS